MRQTFLIIILWILTTNHVKGQDLNYLNDTLNIGKLTGPVIFDGLSDENEWANAYKMNFTTFN
ncbi:MAG: hypothetical protein RIR48_1911, partial [Bacteroidota bacterium]